MHCSTKKKKYSREQLSKVLCVSGWMFSSDIAFLVSRKKNTKMNLIVESSIGRKKKLFPDPRLTTFFSLRATRDTLTTNVVISTLYLRTS